MHSNQTRVVGRGPSTKKRAKAAHAKMIFKEKDEEFRAAAEPRRTVDRRSLFTSGQISNGWSLSSETERVKKTRL